MNEAPRNVQDALDILVDEENIPEVKTRCPSCGQGGEQDPRTWKKFDVITEMPKILMIRLARWSSEAYEANLDCVEANDAIEYKEKW